MAGTVTDQLKRICQKLGGLDMSGTVTDLLARIEFLSGLTSPSTPIGSVTPVAVTSTVLTANTAIRVPSGTAALPAITLAGSTSSGLYFPDAGSFGISAYGTPVLAFTQTGVTELRVSNFYSIGFSSSTNAAIAISDVSLFRDAADTLAQRRGTNSQLQRLYKSFTDASNYTRSVWSFDANGVQIAAESGGTGDANIDITFVPKGTGRVRFGAFAALAAEVITGHIIIKDSSGTLRKLAVIA